MSLNKVAFFKGIKDATRAELSSLSRIRKVAKGDVLFREEESARHVFAVNSGRVRLYQTSPEGQVTGLRILSAGKFFAGIAIMPGAVYPATAEAMEDSEFLVWAATDMLRLVKDDAALSYAFLEVTFERLKDMQARFTELTVARVERRIALTVLRLADQLGTKTDAGILIGVGVTNEILAEMAGTTLYTVSRTLTEWKRREWISTKKNNLLLKNPHELVIFANS